MSRTIRGALWRSALGMARRHHLPILLRVAVVQSAIAVIRQQIRADALPVLFNEVECLSCGLWRDGAILADDHFDLGACSLPARDRLSGRYIPGRAAWPQLVPG